MNIEREQAQTVEHSSPEIVSRMKEQVERVCHEYPYDSLIPSLIRDSYQKRTGDKDFLNLMERKYKWRMNE